MGKFKCGDIVQLVTGGPRMAVESVYEKDSTVAVVWFGRKPDGSWSTKLGRDLLSFDSVKLSEVAS